MPARQPDDPGDSALDSPGDSADRADPTDPLEQHYAAAMTLITG
jgi:hypothetical protein